MAIAKSGPRFHRGARLLGFLALGIALQACSAKLAPYGEEEIAGFRHRTIGYTISIPDWGDLPPWRRIEVEGADLVFSDPSNGDRSSMSLLSECRPSEAHPGALARHLTIGVSDRQLESAGPVALAGDPGWSQTFVTRLDGVAVHVKAVTVVSPRCTFDWVLVMPGPFGGMELVFDRWWASFEFDPGPVDGGSPGEGAR
jgi:hypothetical protein